MGTCITIVQRQYQYSALHAPEKRDITAPVNITSKDPADREEWTEYFS
jgi:hypothetical protein